MRVAETEFEANPNRVASGPVYKPLFGKAGCTYTFSFCRHGGGTNFDSGLSIWDIAAENQLACNIDSCGDRSEVSWLAQADGEYLLRIGGMSDSPITSYTLAYQDCGSCSGDQVSVEKVTWSLVKRLLR